MNRNLQEGQKFCQVKHQHIIKIDYILHTIIFNFLFIYLQILPTPLIQIPLEKEKKK